MFERSASDDDLFPCPDCSVESELRVRFHKNSSGIGHHRTDLLCLGCKRTFSADESRWAYADWNAWAISCWQSKGTHIDVAPLYSLLKEEADFQRSQELRKRDLEEKIATSLERFVDCSWSIGSRFQTKGSPTGIWETTKIERIYATNTGPMWSVHATQVRANGFLGKDSNVFPGRGADQLKAIAPFWRPATWSQLVTGDDCLHNSIPGTLVAVDPVKRSAKIYLDSGESIDITALKFLKVQLVRFINN